MANDSQLIPCRWCGATGCEACEPIAVAAREEGRRQIAEFLRRVYGTSTHGASSLMERAIDAIEANDMTDPSRIAKSPDSSR